MSKRVVSRSFIQSFLSLPVANGLGWCFRFSWRPATSVAVPLGFLSVRSHMRLPLWPPAAIRHRHSWSRSARAPPVTLQQLARRRDAVLPRQFNVHQHPIGLMACVTGTHLLRRCRTRNRLGQIGEPQAQGGSHWGVIFDQQNTWHTISFFLGIANGYRLRQVVGVGYRGTLTKCLSGNTHFSRCFHLGEMRPSRERSNYWLAFGSCFGARLARRFSSV